MVQPPPGRDAEVRREPAEEIPGHLQRQLRERGLERALGRAARRRPHLGRARRHRLPRRQPAHEAGALLGVADRRGAPRPSGGDLPRRGVHAARDDDDAREVGLRAELHVLHVEEHALGAARVHGPAARLVGDLPAERVREHAGHPARVPATRRAARVRGAARARGHAVAGVRDLLRLRELRERAGARRQRGVPRLGEVRGEEARASTGRCCRSSRRSTERGGRTLRCSASTTSRSSRPRTSSSSAI